MERALNTLPMQTYVRTRVETIVVDIGDTPSGTVPLDLEKPSNVTVIVASVSFIGSPEVFIGAIDRTPTLADFDVIMGPVDTNFVKSQGRVTLHLPEGQHEFRWKSCSTGDVLQPFPQDSSRLVLAIDQ